MRCPQCEVELKQRTVDGVIINECSSCQGMWFDRDELETIKDEVLPEMSWLDLDNWKQGAELIARGDPKFCPNCKDSALTAIFDQKSKTEMSFCAQCNGTWLATGQFLLLVNALLDEANQKSAPEFVRISLQQAKELLTSPESVADEWHNLKMVLGLLKHRIFIEHPKLKSIVVGLQKSLPL